MDAGQPAHRVARARAPARSEARHAARLRGHPHGATVHDVEVHEGLPWIVMEYVPDALGLQAVVRRPGPLPPSEVARIGLAVLDALTPGHRVGILHRDVKPANIPPFLWHRPPRATPARACCSPTTASHCGPSPTSPGSPPPPASSARPVLSRTRPPCRDRRRSGPLPRRRHEYGGGPDERRRLLGLRGGAPGHELREGLHQGRMHHETHREMHREPGRQR